VAKLRPISALNAYKQICSVLLLMRSRPNPIARIATNGAKIVIHFIAPVKKNAIIAGEVETKNDTNILVNTANIM
jgi:hypothetical protein